MAVPKIERVRRKLREIIPEWMATVGRPPNREEFLSEYKLRESLPHPQYSKAKLQVMEELGYAGDNNTSTSNAVTMAKANAMADEKVSRELERAAKHLVPVMEKGRLEEVTFTLNPETGKYEMEVQAAPPPRLKVEL